MIENDFVKTPKVVIEALLKYEYFKGEILEPCCGDGAISETLKEADFELVIKEIEGKENDSQEVAQGEVVIQNQIGK